MLSNSLFVLVTKYIELSLSLTLTQLSPQVIHFLYCWLQVSQLQVPQHAPQLLSPRIATEQNLVSVENL